MRSDLDRKEIHQHLQGNDLVEVLDGVRGQSAAEINSELANLGREVRKGVDAELITDLKDPIEADDQLIGVLALLYEAENDTQLEDELSMFQNNDRGEITR